MSPGRAIVTGGSRGIGRAVAGALAEQGWRITLVARDRLALEKAHAELSGDGHDTLVLDVAIDESWQRVGSQLGAVDGLVCAAGVLGPVGPIGTYSAADFCHTLDVNVRGTLLAIQACLPALQASRGAIVTFGGGGASGPLPRFDGYAASKAAVVRLTENLALELSGEGVRVNCVAPGFVATDMHQATLAAGPEMAGEDYFERTRAELERGGAPVDQAAALVCLLLAGGPDASFSGRLISAQWDPWRDPDFRRRLSQDPDLATLRRVDDMFFAAVEERARA